MTEVKNITIYGNLTLTNPAEMFKQSIIENIVLIHSKVELVGDCSRMFQHTKFNIPLPFDTSKVTNMSYMFNYSFNFNQLLLLDTSKVTNMSHMFNSSFEFNKHLEWGYI